MALAVEQPKHRRVRSGTTRLGGGSACSTGPSFSHNRRGGKFSGVGSCQSSGWVVSAKRNFLSTTMRADRPSWCATIQSRDAVSRITVGEPAARPGDEPTLTLWMKLWMDDLPSIIDRDSARLARNQAVTRCN